MFSTLDFTCNNFWSENMFTLAFTISDFLAGFRGHAVVLDFASPLEYKHGDFN